MKNLSFDPDALQELSDAADWYDKQRRGLAADFLRELDAVLTHVRERPLLFSRVPITSEFDIRRALLKRFIYAVVFIDLGDDVRVLAVAHTKRQATYWLGRIRGSLDP